VADVPLPVADVPLPAADVPLPAAAVPRAAPGSAALQLLPQTKPHRPTANAFLP